MGIAAEHRRKTRGPCLIPLVGQILERQQSMLQRLGDELDALAHAEGLPRFLEVALYRFTSDAEPAADVMLGQSPGCR